MSGDPMIWGLIAALGLATYLIRYSFIGLIGDRKLPDSVMQALNFVPVTVLPALVAPAIFEGPDGGFAFEAPKALAAAATLGVGMATRSLLPALLAGAAVYALLAWSV